MKRKYRYLEEFKDEKTGESLGEGQSPKEMGTRQFGKRMLHRIAKIEYEEHYRSGIEYYKEKAGEVGGWIEDYSNLSQSGECWIAGDAVVCGNAMVSGDARVEGTSEVGDNAVVTDKASVSGEACVGGNAYVFEEAEVSGADRIAVSGRSRVAGKVKGQSRVSGLARVYTDGEVSGSARIGGRAVVYGSVGEKSVVTAQSIVEGIVDGEAVVTGDSYIMSYGTVGDKSIIESGVIDEAEMGGESICGSRMLEDFIRENIRTLSQESGLKKFTTENLREFYEEAKGNYGDTFREVVEMYWDKESAATEGAGDIPFPEEGEQYNPYRDSIEDEWALREIPYDELMQSMFGFDVSADGEKMLAPCWIDDRGDIHPMSMDMLKFRRVFSNSRYCRIGGGAAPNVDGGKVEDVPVAGNVYLYGLAEGHNYVTGTASKMFGDMNGNYNSVYGCTNFHGKFRGDASAVWDSLVYGVLSGKDYPSVQEGGLQEAILSKSILGKNGQLIGKFSLYNALIDGIVAGVKEVKAKADGKSYLGINNGQGTYTPTYLLEKEQAVYFKDVSVKVDKEEIKTIEKGVADSLPDSVKNRFSAEAFKGNVGYEYGRETGFYYTWDMLIDRKKAMMESAEKQVLQYKKSRKIYEKLSSMKQDEIQAIPTVRFKS